MVDTQVDKSRCPNLWVYAISSQVDLGYVRDESGILRGKGQ
jgi:hypothetical protein